MIDINEANTEDEKMDQNDLDSFDPDYQYESPMKKNRGSEILWSRKVEIVRLANDHPKWNWQTLKKHGAKELTSDRQLRKWRTEYKDSIIS